MLRATLLAPACVALLLLAGCLTSGPDRQPLVPAPTESPPGGERGPLTHQIPVDRRTSATGLAQGGSFPVPEGATALLVEARWQCMAEACLNNLDLRNPEGRVQSGDAGGTVSGRGAAQLFVEDPMPGIWRVAITGPGAEAIGDIRPTVFFGEVPQGYSAYNTVEVGAPTDLLGGPAGRPANATAGAGGGA